MDEIEVAFGLIPQGIAHAFAISVPQPLLFDLGVHVVRHAFTCRDAHTTKQRVGFDHLTHAGAEILLRDIVAHVIRDAMLSLRTEGEDVPGEDIDCDAAICCLLHDPAPKLDLLIHRDLFHDFMVCKHLRPHHVDASKTERVIELRFRAPDIVESHLGELRHLHHRGKRMQAPKREHVVAMPRHGIKVADPELPLPHLGDIRLGCIGAISVARCTKIEWDVELDASLLNVRFVIGAF